jgi:zinc protease
VVRTELEKLLEQGVTDDELDRAKKYYVNSYPFDFSRPISIVRQTMSNEYRGLPDGFLATYPDLISRITVEEVNEALRRHIRPDSMVTVVVGRREELEQALEPYGRIIIVDEETPPPVDPSP